MTAFGRAKHEGAEKDITVEIKSVNSRYFDCSVKMPRAYLSLEERIKNYVQKNAVARAKVDIYITVDNHSTVPQKLDVDKAYAESYIAALYELRDTFRLADDVTVMSVARNPEVFRATKVDADIDVDVDLLGYVDPGVTVNIIKDGKLAKRQNIDIPERIENVIKCKNPRCITTVEQELSHIFNLRDKENRVYRCLYCESKAK